MSHASPSGDLLAQDRVRTYNARRGRRSTLLGERLDILVPTYAVPPGRIGSPTSGSDDRQPLVVEIGCGYGAATLAYAQTSPSSRVIAIDVYGPGLGALAVALSESGVSGVNIVFGDAVLFLRDRVMPGSVDRVHIFFPDPWPKAKHRKRRFVSPDTLSLLDVVLAPDGRVLIATDQPAYADWVRTQVAAHGVFEAQAAPRPSWRPIAGFEAKALAAGRTAIDLELRRA